jgi:hypothetical protein
MIKLVEVNGWELKDADAYACDRAIVVLAAPLHDEGMGLSFDLINIIPPKRSAFWDFSLFRALEDGAHRYFQNLLSDSHRRSLREVIDVYFSEDSAMAFLSLRGALQYFGNEFPLQDAVMERHRLISVVVPPGATDVFYDYFSLMREWMGDAALIDYDETDVIDTAFMAQLSRVLWDEVDDPALASNVLQRELTKAEKMYQALSLDAVNIAPPNSSLGRGGESLLMERVSWIMKNCSLPEIETHKDVVNSPWWGGTDHSRVRNQLRSLFDGRLHACPVLQTNPYEKFLRDGR